MVSDNDDVIPNGTTYNSELKSTNSQPNSRSSKPTRSGLFTGSIFTRVRYLPMSLWLLIHIFLHYLYRKIRGNNIELSFFLLSILLAT